MPAEKKTDSERLNKAMYQELSKQEREQMVLNIAGSNDIDYIIKKLMQLEATLGGKRAKAEEAKAQGNEKEFYKDTLMEDIRDIKGSLKEWHTQKSSRVPSDVTKKYKIKKELNNDVRDVRGNHEALKKIIDNSSKNKKKPLGPEEKKKWDKILIKFEGIIEDIQNELDGKEAAPVGGDPKSDNYIFEGKKQGKGQDYNSDEGYSDGDRDQEIGDLGKAKAKEWSGREAKLDDDLQDINGVLDEIAEMAEEQLGAQKDLNKLQNTAGKLIGSNKDTAKTLNADLSEILTKLRGPNKTCMDICMIIFVIGLVGMIVNMLR